MTENAKNKTETTRTLLINNGLIPDIHSTHVFGMIASSPFLSRPLTGIKPSSFQDDDLSAWLHENSYISWGADKYDTMMYSWGEDGWASVLRGHQ